MPQLVVGRPLGKGDLQHVLGLLPVHPRKFAVRSQELGTKYYDTGAFCGFPAQRVLESMGPGDDTGFVGYVLPRHKAIDIDTEEDWRLAEILFAGSEVSSGSILTLGARG